MSKPLTLPILAAVAHLHANNLTIDRLWTEHPNTGTPQTHITTRPAGAGPKPDGATAGNVFQYQQALPYCVVCHEPGEPGHATCLSADCLKIYLLGKK
jgi:hypothetical protein